MSDRVESDCIVKPIEGVWTCVLSHDHDGSVLNGVPVDLMRVLACAVHSDAP